MTIAVIAAVCVLLLVLGFLVPRLSRGPQKGVDKTLTAGQSAGSKAPGRLGRWLQKPFELAQGRRQERRRRPARPQQDAGLALASPSPSSGAGSCSCPWSWSSR